jgi:3-dehydroquinate dehydratase type I
VDIEISALISDPGILGQIENAGTNIIASSHNFHDMESFPKMANLITSFPRDELVFAIKIVRKANTFDDNRRMLSLYGLVDKIQPVRLVSFCSGDIGLYSRLVCTQYGSPFTFVSLPNQTTAPGQLDILTVNALFFP